MLMKSRWLLQQLLYINFADSYWNVVVCRGVSFSARSGCCSLETFELDLRLRIGSQSVAFPFSEATMAFQH